jgi:mRNA-degrading endonuclease RelE of RelBE toxin-antitoxin system
MTYTVAIRPAAAHQLKKLTRVVQEQVIQQPLLQVIQAEGNARQKIYPLYATAKLPILRK